MKAALVGFGGVGKSTLFDALTEVRPSAAPRDPTRPRTETMPVHDARLEHLRRLHQPRRYQPARLAVTDYPGWPRSATRTRAELLEGLRRAELLVLVVGTFDGCAALLEAGCGSGAEQLRLLREELVLADLEQVEARTGRLDALRKKGALGDPDRRELELMQRLAEALEEGTRLCSVAVDAADEPLVERLGLLTRKPSFVVVNVSEEACAETIEIDGEAALVLCATLEAELSCIEDEAERAAFLQDFGLGEPVSRRVAQRAFRAADLISFFTTGADEVRAWPIRKGSTAVQAAGKIHTDLARGFIRAEVVPYDLVADCTTLAEYEKLAKARLEGRDWVVDDGAILSIRFSV